MSSKVFSKRALTHPDLASIPSSMPLIIPNDTRYDFSTNELLSIPGERRVGLMIVPETLSLLKTVDRPLAVLAVCGPCRTGKSYILSRILDSTDAFSLGHTFDPKTIGIWIGTTVIDCKEFTILLMDTEGIDSVFTKSRDDACILVMTVLLSSYFIYNSVGVPHHSDLEKMSYFANLANAIAVKNASQEAASAFDFKKYFPDFLWLLRDVHLLPTGDDGREVTPTEYLVSKVLRRGKSFRETKSDEVGRAILTFFPSVECKTVQSPSSNPEVVRDITRRQDSLDPTFNKQVDLLVQYFFQRLQAKKGFSATNLVDGPILVEMAGHYLKAVNDTDAIPCISDTWNTAVEKRCQEVLEKLVREYTQDMEACITEIRFPIEEDSPDDVNAMTKPRSLFGMHRAVLLRKTESLLKQVGHLVSASPQFAEVYSWESLSAQLEHFTAIFEEDKAGRKIHGQQIKRKKVTGGALFKFTQQNYSESQSGCLTLFEKLYQQIQDKMHATQSYTFEELLKDLKILHFDYFKKAVGPAKWEVYDEKRKFIKAQEQSFRLLKGYQQKTFQAIQKAADESAKAAELADSVSKMQVQMRNDAELNQKRMEAMQMEHHEEMQRLRMEEAERMEQERQKYEDFIKAHMQEMAELSNENCEELKKQHDAMLQMMKAVVNENEEQISALNSTVDKLTTAIRKEGENTGSSWPDQLVAVGGTVLEAAIVIAATSGSCSLM